MEKVVINVNSDWENITHAQITGMLYNILGKHGKVSVYAGDENEHIKIVKLGSFLGFVDSIKIYFAAKDLYGMFMITERCRNEVREAKFAGCKTWEDFQAYKKEKEKTK